MRHAAYSSHVGRPPVIVREINAPWPPGWPSALAAASNAERRNGIALASDAVGWLFVALVAFGGIVALLAELRAGFNAGLLMPLHVLLDCPVDEGRTANAKGFSEPFQPVKQGRTDSHVDLLCVESLRFDLFRHHKHGGKSYQLLQKKHPSYGTVLHMPYNTVSLPYTALRFSPRGLPLMPVQAKGRCAMDVGEEKVQAYASRIEHLWPVVKANAEPDSPVYVAFKAAHDGWGEELEFPPLALLEAAWMELCKLPFAERRRVLNDWNVDGRFQRRHQVIEDHRGEVASQYLCVIADADFVSGYLTSDFDWAHDTPVRVMISEGSSKDAVVEALRKAVDLVEAKWSAMLAGHHVLRQRTKNGGPVTPATLPRFEARESVRVMEPTAA